MEKILVTGACGQLGSELITALQKIYGEEQVVASELGKKQLNISGQQFEILNVLDRKRLD